MDWKLFAVMQIVSQSKTLYDGILGLQKIPGAHNALGLASPCRFWKELGNLDCIIVSSWPLSVAGYSSSLIHILSPSESTSLSLTSLSPSILVSLPLLMFLLSLFPPTLKCRNPSTAFYQAFRPSRLRGSKPVNDRYELGFVYMYVWSLAWLNQTLHPFNPAHLAKKVQSDLSISCSWSVFNYIFFSSFQRVLFAKKLRCHRGSHLTSAAINLQTHSNIFSSAFTLHILLLV